MSTCYACKCVQVPCPAPRVRCVKICFNVVDENGRPVCDAVFQLRCGCGKFRNAVSGANGCVTFCGKLPAGNYTLEQIAPGCGFEMDPVMYDVQVSFCGCVLIGCRPMCCFRSVNPRETPHIPVPSPIPGIGPVAAGDVTIEGTGSPGCCVEVTWPTGGTASVTVQRNGNWSLDVPGNLDLANSDVISAVQTCCGDLVSPPYEAIVGA